MSLWAWVENFPTPATVATVATEGPTKGADMGALSQESQESQPVGVRWEVFSDDAREAYEERAAIMEYEGGLSRAEAERRARAIVSATRESDDAPPVAKPRWPLEAWGDLRPCTRCRNLARSGRCLSAFRGELRAARDYEPSIPAQPRRCIGYSPPPDDPDQSPGRERWPELVEWQARID